MQLHMPSARGAIWRLVGVQVLHAVLTFLNRAPDIACKLTVADVCLSPVVHEAQCDHMVCK